MDAIRPYAISMSFFDARYEPEDTFLMKCVFFMLSRPLDAILENVINLKLVVNLRFLLCMKALSLGGRGSGLRCISEGKKY